MIRIHDYRRKMARRAVFLFVAGALASGGFAGASGQRHVLPRPGEWRVILEDNRPGAPVSLAVALIGGRYIPEWEQRTQRREPDDLQRTQVPTLVLQCARGATEVFIDNATLNTDMQSRSTPDSAFSRNRHEPRSDNFILFVLDNKETIELRPWSPAYGNHRLHLPDPFDLLHAFLSHEILWVYWTIEGGELPPAELMTPEAVLTPDVVFELPGLRELLRETQDPCDWLL